MAKLYRRPIGPIDIYKKTPVEKPTVKSQELLTKIQAVQHQRIGNYARLRAKIDHLNNLAKKKKPSDLANIIRYWVKYQ